MRSTLPRHRWEPIATYLHPGAAFYHGRVSVSAPMMDETRAFLAYKAAHAPNIISDPIHAALNDARVAGVQPTHGNLIDVTPFLAARQAQGADITVNGRGVVVGDLVDESDRPDIIGQPLAGAIAEARETDTPGRAYDIRRARIGGGHANP